MIIEGSKNDRQDNCLSLIKLIAALQVMFCHVSIHLNLPVNSIIGKIIGYFPGVPIFFILSGYLIWFSIGTSKTYRHYLGKRFWRIYPELWVCVAAEIISVMIFYRGWNFIDLSVFAVAQGTILQFWTPNSLRGYGCGTPNGTLWTMCVTVQFYLVAWFLHQLLRGIKSRNWIISIVFAIMISIVGQVAVDSLHKEVLSKLFGQTILRYGWLFLSGCMAAEFKGKIIPVIRKYWYCLLLLGLVPYLLNVDINAGYYILRSFLMVSGLIGFAYRYQSLAVKPDISYAIFLYHMIVVNIFISLEWTGKWLSGVEVMICSSIIALVSTKTIGAWAGRHKTLHQ